MIQSPADYPKYLHIKNSQIIIFVLTFLCFGYAKTTFAKIGVGVATGKIVVDEQLSPGTIYELPSITVVNNGDVSSHYGVDISYHEKQPELLPKENWFIFSPHSFYLEPGKTQEVKIKINLPARVQPGEYFAYLEAHPTKTVDTGEVRVGIAAATKLYFTIAPGTLLDGLYFKALTFWKVFAPWPERVAIGLGVLLILFILSKFFKIQIGVRKKE